MRPPHSNNFAFNNFLFIFLKLPNSEAASQQYAERKAKVDELTKTITVKYRYLHLIYDKLNEYASDQMVDVDVSFI